MSSRLPVLVVSLGLIAVLIGFYLLVLRDEGRTELHASSMTVEELYAAVDEKLAAIDGALHVRSTGEIETYYSASTTSDRWLSPDERRVREHTEIQFRYEDESGRRWSDSLTAPEERFTVQDDGDSHVAASRFWQCYGASVAASSLLGCSGLASETERRVEEGWLRGRKVVAVVEEGVSRDSDSSIRFTSWLYLDARTLIPVEMRYEGAYESDTPVPITSTTKFSAPEEVALDSLPADFFEPGGIGYQAPDVLAPLRAVTDLQVYWLGEEITLPDGEVLVLTGSYEVPPPGHPYRLAISYATKAHPHEPPIVTLQVFHRYMWERSPVAIQSRIIGDTVVFINEGTIDGRGIILSKPGNLEFLLGALQPFEP